MGAQVTRLWSLGRCTRVETIEGERATDPWKSFSMRMRRKPSITRVVFTTGSLFPVQPRTRRSRLANLAAPGDPERWSDHILQVLLLAGMTALLASVLDASMRATRLLHACLDQYRDMLGP